ncbi:MAG: hypothetical protein DRP64_18265, partial [Verrucomicrobia bacterium]
MYTNRYAYAFALIIISGILTAGVSPAAGKDKVADPYVGVYEGTYTPIDGQGVPAIGIIRSSTRNSGEYLVLMKVKSDQPKPAKPWGAVGTVVDGKLEVKARGLGARWRGILVNGELTAECPAFKKSKRGKILLTRLTEQPDAVIPQVETKTSPRTAKTGMKRIILIAGRDSHPPGQHDYDAYVDLLAKWLTAAKLPEKIEVKVFHEKRGLDDLSVFDGADTIVIGNDYGSMFLRRSLGASKQFRALMAGGVGLVCLHGGTSMEPVNDITRLEHLDWIGGVWIRGFSRNYSTKQLKKGQLLPLPSPEHPICRGVKPFSTSEESYCPMWFTSKGKLEPLVHFPMRGGLQTIGWAFERPDGGRSFGYTGMHALKTLGVDDVRKLLLNAILWTAKMEVPAQGVASTVKPEEILPKENLPKQLSASAPKKSKPKRKGHVSFQDSVDAGPDFLVQGEYLGEQISSDGSKAVLGAQVIANSEGKFQAFVLKGGLPGAGWNEKKARIELEGATHGKKTSFPGLKGWEAEIENGVMTGKGGEGITFRLKKTERKSSTLGAKPPKGAIVLFDGTNADEWTRNKIDKRGFLRVGVKTKKQFGDCSLHIEFRTPFMPTARKGARGNSGVFFQGLYEVQIQDSFG